MMLQRLVHAVEPSQVFFSVKLEGYLRRLHDVRQPTSPSPIRVQFPCLIPLRWRDDPVDSISESPNGTIIMQEDGK